MRQQNHSLWTMSRMPVEVPVEGIWELPERNERKKKK